MATVASAVVIASGATTSSAYDVGNVGLGGSGGIVGFAMPSAFTGASVTFQVSVDDVTYQALYDSANSQISITVSASRTYGFKQDVRAALSPWRFIKIVSASAEGGARTINVLVK